MLPLQHHMIPRLRPYLLDRYVILLFSLPALGYLGFLSQFVFGAPGGPVRIVLEALFLFTLPVLRLYSITLGVFPAVDQEVGTVGFFVFAYVFALTLVVGVFVGRQVIRDRGLV